MERERLERLADSYERKLIFEGKKVAFENPDKLEKDEVLALTEKIFSELNSIGIVRGYGYHETGIKLPDSISRERQEELFEDFLDWYQVIPTPSMDVYNYVVTNYPINRFPRVLCVGDGKNSHLGRKLAIKGYDVVSVDPLARSAFSGENDKIKEKRKGRFHAVSAQFLDTSKDMIDWANIIVGSKVPLCAEYLVKMKKPTIFNISENPEICNMKFKGIPITSAEQLKKEISKCSGVMTKRIEDTDFLRRERILFICGEKEIEERE